MARTIGGSGSGDGINCGNAAALDFDKEDAFSIYAWTTIAGGAGAHRVICSKCSGTAGNFQGYIFQLSNGNDLRFSLINNSGGGNLLTEDSDATIGVTSSPTMLGATYDGSEAASGVTLYHNGSAVASSAVDDTLTSTISNSTAYGMGLIVGGTVPLEWNGDLDKVCIWDVELTADEMAALGEGVDPTRIRPNSIVGYWPLRGDSPEVDLSGNANNGTVTGTSVTDPLPTVPYSKHWGEVSLAQQSGVDLAATIAGASTFASPVLGVSTALSAVIAATSTATAGAMTALRSLAASISAVGTLVPTGPIRSLALNAAIGAVGTLVSPVLSLASEGGAGDGRFKRILGNDFV